MSPETPPSNSNAGLKVAKKKPKATAKLKRPKDTAEERARARVWAYFEDQPDTVFYSRQIEILFEREFFHWVTNRAIRGLIDEGRIRTERRELESGSEVKLLWHKNNRFYKREADRVYRLVDEYTSSASSGTLGLQGESLVLAAFARQRFLLVGEETNEYCDKKWTATGHDLDFVFERDGIGYGIEVKNTLGYMEIAEFHTKIKMAQHLGIRPVFVVRSLPSIWVEPLVRVGGYAMIMGFQFYPWTHKELANRIRDTLGLPVDTPKRIEHGTMQRFENWIASPRGASAAFDPEAAVRADIVLSRMKSQYQRKLAYAERAQEAARRAAEGEEPAEGYDEDPQDDR